VVLAKEAARREWKLVHTEIQKPRKEGTPKLEIADGRKLGHTKTQQTGKEAMPELERSEEELSKDKSKANC